MRPLAAFIVSLLFASLPFSAVAQEEQDEDEFSRPGVYVGIGGTFGIYAKSESALKKQLSELGFAGQSEGPDDAFGGEFYVGYRTSEFFAVEAQLEYFSPATIEVAGTDVAELSGYAATLSGKFFPIRGRFQPYGAFGVGALIVVSEDKLGLGFKQSTKHDGGLVLRAGGGIDYYLTRILALNIGLDYLLPVSAELEDADILSVSLGVMARF